RLGWWNGFKPPNELGHYEWLVVIVEMSVWVCHFDVSAAGLDVVSQGVGRR
ncbi:hypothetical protein CISIN_1g0468751mg, partial [Citrus sinensis]